MTDDNLTFSDHPADPAEYLPPKPDEHTLEQREAAQALTALDSELWYDLGPKLTCVEADAISAFLTAWGAPADAAALMRSHSETDDEGDAHFTPLSLPEGVAVRTVRS